MPDKFCWRPSGGSVNGNAIGRAAVPGGHSDRSGVMQTECIAACADDAYAGVRLDSHSHPQSTF